MPSGLSTKVSLSNWVLGGSLITFNKDEGRRQRAPRRRVVLTEIDSDGNEVDKHVLPLSKVKTKKGIKLTSDHKHDPDSEIEMPKKNTTHKDNSTKGRFCTDCGGKRDGPSTTEEKVNVDVKSKDATKDEVTVQVKDINANTGDSQPNVHPWTDDQDQTIKKMKDENKSWKEIAAAVGTSKKDVQNRYKSFSTIPKSDEKPDNKVDGEKETPSSGLNIPDLDFSRLFLDYTDDSGVEGGASGNDAPFSTLTGYEGYHGSHEKDDNKEKKDSPKCEGNGGGWYKISPKGSVIDKDSKAISPRLREDDVWSADDCELLEQLEANYRKIKWLQMQADFFNWTGRMVEASIIEKKFTDDGFN